jgi:hypothetical protein
MSDHRRSAPVPVLEHTGVPGSKDNEFAALNKQLRACYVCKLIKATTQVRSSAYRRCAAPACLPALVADARPSAATCRAVDG